MPSFGAAAGGWFFKMEKEKDKEQAAGARNIRSVFSERLDRHKDELKWLYMELYGNEGMFSELCSNMEQFALARSASLTALDAAREADPDWYRGSGLLGMMFYIDNFAGNLSGVRERLDYVQECNVNTIHLMPFLDSPAGRSDGGYAVSDFDRVRPDLGTMEDLEALTAACRERGICVCMDFIMNHTSEEHKWARRARGGEIEYRNRYFIFHTPDIPRQYERTVPQVFPTTAPGNFTRLTDTGEYVLTTFYPYQWDLNYKNPRVFNEMMYSFLTFANRGIDIFRLDAVPYIWKELGTNCRNLPKVHTLIRMMRMIGEIVCPGVLLLGEVVMEPQRVVPYFGSPDKPECHMLYNVTTMATIWHTVATRDVRLLKMQLDSVNALPKNCVFLNYLRCHDDLGWGLDYEALAWAGMQETSHKRYLNNYFLGQAGYSASRGELYNDDPVSGDARFCGTTASMCGLETAEETRDAALTAAAVNLDVMLHAFLFFLSGVPILYSGDEIGQLNDYSYHEDPLRAADSRYVHRGKMNWERAARRTDSGAPQGRIFSRLQQLETIRRREKVFGSDAAVWTAETKDPSVLCVIRVTGADKMIGLFNFSEHNRTARIDENDGEYRDLLTGARVVPASVPLTPYRFYWLKRQ